MEEVEVEVVEEVEVVRRLANTTNPSTAITPELIPGGMTRRDLRKTTFHFDQHPNQLLTLN